MSRLAVGPLFATGFVFVAGSVGVYTHNDLERADSIVLLEQEIGRLKDEAQRQSAVEVPDDREANAAIVRSGRTIRISECKSRQAVPGVTCTRTITTVGGSFAGTTQPGVLSFAKIDGTWVQIQ